MTTNKAGLMAGVCGLPIFAAANNLNLATDFNGGLAFKAAVTMRLWKLKSDGEALIKAAANGA